MAIDLNADLGTIIQGLFAKKDGGNNAASSGGGAAFAKNAMAGFPIEAYKYALIILAIVLAISGAYIYMVYMPLREENMKKTEELNKAIEMKNQLSVLDSQIKTLKSKLDKSKEEYVESLAHFGNSEDLGALYQTVSTLAAKYNMVVLNVKDVPIPPEKPQPAAKKADKDAPPPPKKPAIEVKEIKVDIELKGHYGEYMQFKQDLALAAILLKINSESIMVKDSKTDQGNIYIKLNLSTYAIDKKPFQGIVTTQPNEENNNEKAN